MEHRIFSINEMCKGIVDMVADSYDFDRKETRKPLLTLARVSRSFTELALDELWRELEDVKPLVGLLPPNSYYLTLAGSLVSSFCAITS